MRSDRSFRYLRRHQSKPGCNTSLRRKRGKYSWGGRTDFG